MNIFVTLGACLLLLVSFCAYLVVKLPKKYFLKYLLIPSVLAYGLLVVMNYGTVQGYPYALFPHGRFLLVSFRSVGVDEQRVIEMWITQRDVSRLYVIPYDTIIEKMLKEARISQEEGVLSELEFDGNSGGGGDGHSLGNKLSSHPLDVRSSLPPKK